MSLDINEKGWGNAQVADLEQVFKSVCSTFEEVGIVVSSDILIKHCTDDGPMVIREKGPNGEHTVLLSSEDCRWCQHAFQFAHEYCHIFVEHQNAPHDHKYKWFEESLCELASLWCLRRMSESWIESPPYENWRQYAVEFSDYFDERTISSEKFDSVNEFRIWLDEKMPKLKSDPLLRDVNLVVAVQLLKIFEECPGLWSATAEINVNLTDGDNFRDYLSNWRKLSKQPMSVDLISSQMGY